VGDGRRGRGFVVRNIEAVVRFGQCLDEKGLPGPRGRVDVGAVGTVGVGQYLGSDSPLGGGLALSAPRQAVVESETVLGRGRGGVYEGEVVFKICFFTRERVGGV